MQVLRWMIADYLNVGSDAVPNYALMGTGFNKIDEQLNPQTKETAYVDDQSKTTRTLGYKNVFPFDAEVFTDETAVMKIYNIARNRLVGSNAEVNFIRTDIVVDALGVPLTTAVPARKFRCSVEVTEFSGTPTEELKLTGNLNGIGDHVEAMFDLTAKTVVVAGDAALVLTVTSVAGTSSGNTDITVSPAKLAANSYKYRLDATAPALPVLFDVLTTGWTAWDGLADIAATTGHTITVAEVNADNKCIRVGQDAVVSAT